VREGAHVRAEPCGRNRPGGGTGGQSPCEKLLHSRNGCTHMTETLVLLSGGLDSAVLLASEARDARVRPLYIRVGLAWEDAELQMVRRLLQVPVFQGRAAPLDALEFNMRDVYASTHWAIRGVPPAYDTPDEDVYLAGRNIVFLSKAAVVAASHGISRIALGPLAGNPFPDATPAFFKAMAHALSVGLAHTIEVATPFLCMRKEDVIRLGATLSVPLESTLSCMNPLDAPLPIHCGLCSKCRERRDAFAAAGVHDRTCYGHGQPR
jgi:7-cyano-7-deazaguanine synthase